MESEQPPQEQTQPPQEQPQPIQEQPQPQPTAEVPPASTEPSSNPNELTQEKKDTSNYIFILLFLNN
jgi:hypothetical protein